MISIISLGQKQISAIPPLAKAIWEIAYKDILTKVQIEYMLEYMYNPQKIQSEINTGIQWYIVWDDKKAIGYCNLEQIESTIHIPKFYLLPDYHGKGIAQQMMNYLEKEAIHKNCILLELGVNRFNTRAIRFYEKYGFKTVSKKITDIGNGYVMDDFILQKRLTRINE